jgi:hypothetical protein
MGWICVLLLILCVSLKKLQESAQAYSPAHKVYSDVYEQLDDASIVKLTQLVDLQDSRNTSTQLSIRSDSLELSQHDDPLARLHRWSHAQVQAQQELSGYYHLIYAPFLCGDLPMTMVSLSIQTGASKL